MRMPHDLVRACLERNPGRLIGRAVIDDDHGHAVDPGDDAGNRADDVRDIVLFIESAQLSNQTGQEAINME